MRCPTLSELPPPPPHKTDWPWTEESLQLSKVMADGLEWPRVSIVTPNYNYGEFIEETIRSVLLQGYPNLEYIVIDGGSDDNSIEVIRKYEKWLSFWVSERDTGQANAINKGMCRATGQIIAYINSDDYYYPNAFSKAVKSLLISESDVYYSSVKVLPNQEIMYGIAPESLEEWIRAKVCSIAQPSVFWRRKENLPAFEENLDFVFDRQFFMKLVASGFSFYKDPAIREQPLAFFRLHESSKTVLHDEKFFRENMAVNFSFLKYLPLEKRVQLQNYLSFHCTRYDLHKLNNLSLQNILLLVNLLAKQPSLIFQRELYGKIRRLLYL